MKSLESSLIQLEYSRAFSSRMDALEFYNNQDAKKIPKSNNIKPILIIGGIIAFGLIGLYIYNKKLKEIKKSNNN
jgi:hypothetical protein